MRLETGNPIVTLDTNILDLKIPEEMRWNVRTGLPHVDFLCAGDGMTPSTVMMLTGIPGAGKCLGKGTPILMHNGSIKTVEEVCVGDLLMGPDSNPRTVLSLARGQEEMFRINPVKGDSWVCNRSHILSLKVSGQEAPKNISVDEYLKLGSGTRERLKQYRSSTLSFGNNEPQVDPYFFGLWLGDGTATLAQITTPDPEIKEYINKFADINKYRVRVVEGQGCQTFTLAYNPVHSGGSPPNPLTDFLRSTLVDGEKRIPKEYLTASILSRLKLLAGIVDTDGHLSNNGYEIITKFLGLKDDILFLARSLGFAAYATTARKTIKETGFSGDYWRIFISGETSKIPCLVPDKQATKRTQVKDVLNTGITVESIGVGDYYGFEIDGDHLFILGDFTVTHNTTLALQLADAINGYSKLVAQHPANIREALHLKEAVALYNTGEESLFQVRKTVERLDLKHGFIPSYFSEASDLLNHCDQVRARHPGKQIFLIHDSLQTMEVTEEGKKGRPLSEENMAVRGLEHVASYTKRNFMISIVIGQVTKEGVFTGKNKLKHLIDCHLHLSLDTNSKSETFGQRVAEMQKNRFGPSGLYYPFKLEAKGLKFLDDQDFGMTANAS